MAEISSGELGQFGKIAALSAAYMSAQLTPIAPRIPPALLYLEVVDCCFDR